MRRTRLAGAALSVVLAATGAHAALVAQGPINPQNGFPLYYTDTNGVSLQIGLDGSGADPVTEIPDGLSVFEPVDPNNPFSVQIGFGAEAFYWLGESTMAVPGGEALLVLALEAAFVNEDPAAGDQMVFARTRVRIDTTVGGTYTVTHPYGQKTYENVGVGRRAINDTVDLIGLPPDFEGTPPDPGPLEGFVGPFLVAVDPAPPAGFLGDPRIEQTVTGSPFGTNYFRIDGPPGSNLDGQGNDFIQTDLFTISGQILVPEPVGVVGLVMMGGMLGISRRRRL